MPCNITSRATVRKPANSLKQRDLVAGCSRRPHLGCSKVGLAGPPPDGGDSPLLRSDYGDSPLIRSDSGDCPPYRVCRSAAEAEDDIVPAGLGELGDLVHVAPGRQSGGPLAELVGLEEAAVQDDEVHAALAEISQ